MSFPGLQGYCLVVEPLANSVVFKIGSILSLLHHVTGNWRPADRIIVQKTVLLDENVQGAMQPFDGMAADCVQKTGECKSQSRCEYDLSSLGCSRPDLQHVCSFSAE